MHSTMDVYFILFYKCTIIIQILDFAPHSSSSHKLRNCYSCIFNGKSTQWGYRLLYSGHVFITVVRKVKVDIRDYLKYPMEINSFEL